MRRLTQTQRKLNARVEFALSFFFLRMSWHLDQQNANAKKLKNNPTKTQLKLKFWDSSLR